MSVHVIEAKFLLLEVCTTTLRSSIYHMKSVHITEAKFLLRKVDYYIETQYLTPWCQYIWLRQSFYCWRSVLLHWVPVSIGARTAAGRAELGRTGQNRAASISRLALRRGGRRPLPAGPWLNPRQGGDAPRERRPGLIRGWTAPGRAELGRSGLK